MNTNGAFLRVCKFGGTSLCDADSFKKCSEIIKDDPSRRFTVLSAPGKRFKNDIKITDLLYKAYDIPDLFGETVRIIAERIGGIAKGLGLRRDYGKMFFAEIERAIKEGRDCTASRGEYFSALMMSEYLSFEFIDAADVIFFGDDGSLLKEKTESALKERLSFTQRAIIPGFYGSMPDGKIRTFSRGGSDITGALIAAACDADVYENFTDVDGVMPADPRIVGLLPVIGSISYKELREMSYMGASVLHEDAVSPARSAGIPINIRNTFNPTAEGTFILDKSEKGGDTPGVAGKDGYILINVCLPDGKQRRNSLNSLISILSRHGIEAEHIITGIDLITAIVSEKTVLEKEKEIIKAICLECDAPIAEIKRNRSLVATIGKSVGLPFLARLLEEFGKRDIDVSEMSYGSGENLLFFCIPTAVKNSAVKAAAGVILEKAGERKPQTLKIKDI